MYRRKRENEAQCWGWGLTRSWASSSRTRYGTRDRPNRTSAGPCRRLPCRRRSSPGTRWPCPRGFALGLGKTPSAPRTRACRSSCSSSGTSCCRCCRPTRTSASTRANTTPGSVWSSGSVSSTSAPRPVCVHRTGVVGFVCVLNKLKEGGGEGGRQSGAQTKKRQIVTWPHRFVDLPNYFSIDFLWDGYSLITIKIKLIN